MRERTRQVSAGGTAAPRGGRALRRWRLAARRLWGRVTRAAARQDFDEGWLILLFAALIGLGAGYAILGFYGLVDRIRALAERAGTPATGRGAVLLALPAGLAVAGWLRSRDGRESGGAMVPMLILAAAKRGGELPLGIAVRKVLAAGVTLGSGGSLGAEGPVAVAGATVGSGLGQLFGFGPNRVKLLLAAGTAAGISAAFNAPIAGVLFALEVVLGTFAVTALSPVVVASVVAAVVSRHYRGASPAFSVPAEFVFSSWRELGLYALLGLACGAGAVLFVRAFYASQDLVERATDRLGAWSAPLLAGLAVAALGLHAPFLLGDGRAGIEAVLSSRVAGAAALGLGLMKMATSGLTMAGGGVGGVFTPSLFVGASLGSFFGLTAVRLLPGLGITPEAYALVGMAGVVAGASFAPLTAILMIFEITDDYGLILPLMLVCVLAYLVARRLSEESIYSESLARRGERIRHGADRSVLENVHVADAFDRDPHVVREDAPLRHILSQLKGSRQTEFPVVDRELRLVGMLSYREIARALDEPGLFELLVAADLCATGVETVTPEDSLLDALRRMGVRDIDWIPVVDRPGSRRLQGLLGRAHILEAYQTRLLLPT